MDSIFTITDNKVDFANKLKTNVGEIVGFIPPNTEVLEETYKKIEKIFEDPNIGVVYSDILITSPQETYYHIYRDYDTNFDIQQVVLSPVFVRANKPIEIDYNLEYLIGYATLLKIHRTLFPYHIPEILFNVCVNEDVQKTIKADIEKITKNEHINNYCFS